MRPETRTRATGPMLATLAALFTLLTGGSAQAHAVHVQAKQVGTLVVVEVFFVDDEPATWATVRILDGAETLVAEGETDARGAWSFPAPAPGGYRVVVDAGDGHTAKRSLTIESAVEGAKVVTGGPTREEITGPTRWLLAAAGVALIVGVSWAWSRLRRRTRAS